jgi:hypothetical protein
MGLPHVVRGSLELPRCPYAWINGNLKTNALVTTLPASVSTIGPIAHAQYEYYPQSTTSNIDPVTKFRSN